MIELNGERDHVGRPSRHFAGLLFPTPRDSRKAKRIPVEARLLIKEAADCRLNALGDL
jgi:hypothetical protein